MTPADSGGSSTPVGVAGAPEGTVFSLRIVTVDHYMSRPVEGLDIGYSGFLGTAIDRVPVLRIFGATPMGQKVCLHLHTAFPYFFLPLDDDLGLQTIEQVDTFISRLATSLARAMDVSLGGNKGQYIYKIMPIKAKNFYGYHPAEGIFLKVFITNPNHLPHILRFLRSGAIMNRTFQPFEAHIPYQLQVFVDHNLYGMGLLHLSDVAFRPPLPAKRSTGTSPGSSTSPSSGSKGTPATMAASSVGNSIGNGSGENVLHKVWSLENVPRGMLRTDLPRLSKCEIEIDARCKDLANLKELRSQRLHPSAQADVKLVKSLASMWEEDRMRRVAQGKPSQASPVVTPERADIPHFPMPEDALRVFERLISQDKAEDVPPSTSAATGVASAAPSHMSPQLQAFFQETPRASDPEAIFADHTPASGELASQITQLNPDVVPEVNVELVLSQASDREMRDILNWMHDYDSDDDGMNDEDEDDIDGGGDGHGDEDKRAEQEAYGSQKEVEEIMASQAEVTRAEQSLMEKSAALLQEARKNSEAAKEMCKQFADGSSQRRRLDKGKEKAVEESPHQGRTVDDSSDEDEVSDEELRALLRDIPQFDGGDDELPAGTVPLHKKRPLGADAPKRSNKQPDLPPTVKYQAKLQKLDRYCNLFNMRAATTDRDAAPPRRDRERKSKGRDREAKRDKGKEKEKEKGKEKRRREKREPRAKEKQRRVEKEAEHRDKETKEERERAKRKNARREEDEQRRRERERMEREERRAKDDERRRSERDRTKERGSEHDKDLRPPKRGLRKRVPPEAIPSMLEDKQKKRTRSEAFPDATSTISSTTTTTSSTITTTRPTSTGGGLTRQSIASAASTTTTASSRRAPSGAGRLSLSRRLQAKEAVNGGAANSAAPHLPSLRSVATERSGSDFKVPRETTTPRVGARPALAAGAPAVGTRPSKDEMSSDMVAMLATLVPVTPDTSPEKPSQQRKAWNGSQEDAGAASAKSPAETEDGQVPRQDDDEEESTDDELDREPRLSPLSVIPQTPDSEIQDKKTKRKRKKTKAKVVTNIVRKQAVKPPLAREEANTRREAVEEDSLDLIPETPQERQPRVTAKAKKAVEQHLDERVEVVAETQMTERPSVATALISSTATSTMPHFTAVSFGSCASMPVTCAQSTAPADERNASLSSQEEDVDERDDDGQTKNVHDPMKLESAADAREPGVGDLKRRQQDDNSEDLSQASLHFSLSLWSPESSMAMPSSQVFAVRQHERAGEVVLTPDYHHRHRRRDPQKEPRRREGGAASAAAPEQHQSSWSSEFSVPLLSAESPTKDAVAGPSHASVRLQSSPTARNGEKQQQETANADATAQGPSEREDKNAQQRQQSPPTGEEIEVSEELMINMETASAGIVTAPTIDDEPNKVSEDKEANDLVRVEERTEEHGKEEEDEEERREREREEQVRLIRERMTEKKRRKEALKMQASADLLPCTPYPASAPLQQQSKTDDISPEVLLASIVDDEILGDAAHEEANKEETDNEADKRDHRQSLTTAVNKHDDVVPTSDGAKSAQRKEGDVAIGASPPSIVADSSDLAVPAPVGAGLYRWALLPPTKKEVVQALKSNDPELLPYEHHPPFFSDAKDAPRQAKNIGGTVLRLSVGELADIPAFDTARLAALWGVKSGPLAERREWPRGLEHYARVKAEQAKHVPIRIRASPSRSTDPTTTHARPLKRRKRGFFYTPTKTPPTRAEVQRLLDIEKLFVANDRLDLVAEAAARKRKASDQHARQEAGETWKHLKVVKDPAAGGGAEDAPAVTTGDENDGANEMAVDEASTAGRKRVRFEEIARNGGQMPPAAAAATAHRARSAAEERSQIERVTPGPGDTCGFAVSGNGFRRDKAASTNQSVEQQHVTLMSIEVHVNTRMDLKPNPALDAVTAIFYCIRDDDPEDNSEMVGILVTVQEEALFTTHGLDCRIDVFKDERAMLLAFAQLVSQIDPDILVGYEVQMSSLGYLIERGYALRMNLCEELSRMNVASVGNSHFDKKQDLWGYSHASGVHITGRMVLNVWRILRSELRLTSYSYQNTAYHVLHKRIPYYSHATMTGWYTNHNGAQRWRVLQHYAERVQHYLDMLQQMDIIGRTSEMARVYGIDFFAVLSRGSQYRVESMMIRLTKLHNYVLISPSRQQVAGQAAIECIPLVMEPLSRFYPDPVIVLDFQSLYPSIVIAYNYCYSTCMGSLRKHPPAATKVLGTSTLSMPKGLLAHLQENIFVTPNEVMFVTKEVREGVLPRLLREILETRIVVKAAMKLAKNDKALYKKLNAQQFGLKMIANVTYGYTSANFSGRMPCVEIADSIVQTGRETLESAIRLVNSTRKWGANVIYGDTDSLFVCVPGATREQAFKVGREIAEAVTKANPWPVTLQFEKVYHPCILLAKKRYVGYKYESVDQKEPTFEAKGIETVRRDTCPAVSKILEKSLRLLFEQGDVSLIKAFVQRQWSKLAAGRVSLKDFIFAKEVKLGTYSTKVPAPPAALVCQKEMASDPRAEPRYGERVPYVVVCGGPQARLMDLVVSPHTLIANPNLKLNARYYIDKQIVPALARVFGLIGVDVKNWYAEMPRSLLVNKSYQLETLGAPAPPAAAAAAGGSRASTSTTSGGITLGGIMPYERVNPNKVTIDQYYLSKKCALCENLTKKTLCSACMKNKQGSYYLLMTRMRVLEKETAHLEEICMSCCGVRKPGEDGIRCASLDCEVFFERTKVSRAMHSYRHMCQSVLEW